MQQQLMQQHSGPHQQQRLLSQQQATLLFPQEPRQPRLKQPRCNCKPAAASAQPWGHSSRSCRPRHQLVVQAVAADMGSHHNSYPMTQQLQQRAVAALHSIQQPLQQVLQPSQHDAELLHLAAPALAAMLLEPLMNVVSAAVLGHLGTQQLGAVSLASLATSLATYIFSFLVFLTTPRIAAAHAHGDSRRVSRLAAVGLWLAAVTGTAVAVGMHAGADLIVQALKPREPEVYAYAVSYIRVRSFGIVAAMLGFVASGSYRGIKDTATPLKAAMGAAATHLVLTPLFILGLNWGVFGAGLAATLSTWVSCAILIGLMFQRRVVLVADLAAPPQRAEVVPYLWKGAVLAFRMIVTFGMVMFASAICVRAGAASQAAFEIIRQAWIISVQLFESLNVAMQAMAAAYLGRADRSSARGVLVRALQVSTAIGIALGLFLAAFSQQVVGLFTKDAAVAALAGVILPIIAVIMPLDAAASITDGGLIAAGQTNALSVIQVLGTLVQYGVMAALLSAGMNSVVHVWAVLKVLTVARLAGGLWMHFGSRQSAYLPKQAAKTAGAAAPSPEASHHVAAAAAPPGGGHENGIANNSVVGSASCGGSGHHTHSGSGSQVGGSSSSRDGACVQSSIVTFPRQVSEQRVVVEGQ